MATEFRKTENKNDFVWRKEETEWENDTSSHTATLVLVVWQERFSIHDVRTCFKHQADNLENVI